MKRKVILFSGVISLFFFCGCFKKSDDNLLNNFKKKVIKSDNYYLSGELEIMNNEDIYSYIVEVAYKKDDQFRVELKNKTNDHTQIILKNAEGVFVLTPSLNKSFKFQSDWPYNGSQSYLLQTIISDIENDSDSKIETNDEGIIVTTKTNYANNKNLVSQKIYIDKDSNVTKVEVYDKDGTVKIKMTFSDVDYDTKFDNNYFDLNSNMQASKAEELEESTKQIEDTLYPMFLPDNTYLSGENKVSKTDGERVILTFTGEKPFTLVQETVSVSDDFETITTFGEPELLLDTIGILDDQTVSWISEGVEYYITSDVMSKSELLEVAASISQVPIEK